MRVDHTDISPELFPQLPDKAPALPHGVLRLHLPVSPGGHPVRLRHGQPLHGDLLLETGGSGGQPASSHSGPLAPEAFLQRLPPDLPQPQVSRSGVALCPG